MAIHQLTVNDVSVVVKGTVMDAIERMEDTLRVLRQNDPVPCAYYKGRWVSVWNHAIECFELRRDQYIKEQLKLGKTLNEIKDWALQTIEPLWNDLEKKADHCLELWGVEWRNQSGLFILCLCILLKLKVVENDLQNGFGYNEDPEIN